MDRLGLLSRSAYARNRHRPRNASDDRATNNNLLQRSAALSRLQRMVGYTVTTLSAWPRLLGVQAEEAFMSGPIIEQMFSYN